MSSNYTQIHSAGISQLNDLDVTGISTFAGQVDFNSNVFGIGAKFGNIRIAITDDNTIDTSAGDITLNADSGITRIIDNLIVDGNNLIVNTGDATSIGGTITARIDNARDIQLGMGSTDGAVKIQLHANDRTTNLSKEGNTEAEGSLTIERLADDKFTSSVGDSRITHKGASDLIVNTADANSNISLKTNDTQRVHVGYSGTVRLENDNALLAMQGTHLSLVQSGDGDSALSWVHDKNNINQRWYAGIDASDGYAWKLAHPEPTLAFNSEDWDNSQETKLSVAANGNTVVGGELRIGGAVLDSSAPVVTVFGTPVQANVLNSAHTITIGSNSNTSFVNIRGTKEAVTTSTGALTVGGGVGIAGNLYVGGHMNDTDIIGTLDVSGNVNFGSGKFTLNTSTGDGVFGGKVNTGGDLTVTGNVIASGGLDIEGNSDINGDLRAVKFIKKFPTNNDGTNFLRADGTDTNLTEQDFIDSLGFVPGAPITISSYPIGNSIILDSIDQNFNNSKVEFNLTRNSGTAFVPVGPVNLLVSLGGVIQEANKDYFIKTNSSGDFTNVIRFVDAPPSGMNCYIIALGGQGALLSDPAWERKGEIAVGLKDNQAAMMQVGSNGQVLTADSSVAVGMAFKDLPPGVLTGSIFYWPTTTPPAGYQKCDGGAAQTAALRAIVGNNVPNMINKFVLGGNSPIQLVVLTIKP